MENHKLIVIGKDKNYSIAIMTPFVILTIQYFLLANISTLGIDIEAIIQLLSKVIVGIILSYTIIKLMKTNKILIILVYLFALTLFLIQYIIFIENRLYVKELIFPIFFMCLPLFVISLNIKNINTLMSVMKKSSFIIYFFSIVLSIEDLIGIVNIGDYSGPLSNYLLIPTLVFLNKSIEKLSIKYLFLSIVSIFFILILGSRGAILCITVFIILKIMFLNGKNKFYNLLIKVVVIVFVSLFIFNYKAILYELYLFLVNNNIESRTIQLFLSDELYLSGRDSIYIVLIKYIIEHPIMGFGIGGDRRILSGEAVYAHNILIEVIGNFGLLIGLFVLFVLFTIILYALFNFKGKNKTMIIIWLSIGFVHLFISSSYLIEMKFWIFIGLLINIMFIKTKITLERENE
ncbi:O-antigen ligase family protein [Staphylococcus hominis]|uniref:O-antigen ligase family protein n=2 Tax=Staphylococcus hominis TaxID=1290 RepID=A0A8X8GSN6_STAHO|nr:O-antigen ligase family protein [Staphylococcus hominis]MBK1407228.1 O-antigen ligase family protein [Staphylococcus hominis]MCM5673272.1 O-antigen ligase family protein [Staphylococcus hominis]